LTAREIKEKKLFKFDNNDIFNYGSYIPLYKLWKSYIHDIISSTPPSAYTTKIIKSDFHGAKMFVSKSKNPSLVGISGIVIKESKNCFYFVTKENKLKRKFT
jgi:ribonuclease P protein subunit POP4